MSLRGLAQDEDEACSGLEQAVLYPWEQTQGSWLIRGRGHAAWGPSFPRPTRDCAAVAPRVSETEAHRRGGPEALRKGHIVGRLVGERAGRRQRAEFRPDVGPNAWRQGGDGSERLKGEEADALRNGESESGFALRSAEAPMGQKGGTACSRLNPANAPCPVLLDPTADGTA